MSSIAVLQAVDNKSLHPILEDLQIEASICDVLSRVTVTQTYRNVSPSNIEAIYTFPLPLQAELLGLTIHLNDRVLQGHVEEKATAETEYEDALEGGHSAFMLEQLEPGLYTMNVGNIRSGESVTVELVWGQLMEWSGDRMEFRVPTVPAVRYGDIHDAGMDVRTKPSRDPARPITLSMTCLLRGILSDADVSCPTHELDSIRNEGGELLLKTTPGQAIPDRDFVLKFVAPHTAKTGLMSCKDGAHHLLVSHFQPSFPTQADQPCRNVIFLVDCSGSMNGDSIAQARDALRRALAELEENDQFAIVKYGSTVEPIHHFLEPASERAIAATYESVRMLKADLGGTELGKGLASCWEMAGHIDGSVEIILITDGHVTASQSIAKKCGQHNCRIHGIGVGSAVTEQTLRSICEETGGACELVTPRDDIGEKVVSMFRRIRNPLEATIAHSWPGEPVNKFSTAAKSVYDGDTIFSCAWYAEKPEGVARMVSIVPGEDAAFDELLVEQALVTDSVVDSSEIPDLARLIAAKRIKSIDDHGENQAACKLALQYQLISPWTSYIAIYARQADEQSDDMPKLARVRQAFPAGSHGFGTVTSAGLDRLSRNAQLASVTRPMEPLGPISMLSASIVPSNTTKRTKTGVLRAKPLKERDAKRRSKLIHPFLRPVRKELEEFAETQGLDLEQVSASFLKLILESFQEDLGPEEQQRIQDVCSLLARCPSASYWDDLCDQVRHDLGHLVQALALVTTAEVSVPLVDCLQMTVALTHYSAEAARELNESAHKAFRKLREGTQQPDITFQVRGEFISPGGAKVLREFFELYSQVPIRLDPQNIRISQQIMLTKKALRVKEGCISYPSLSRLRPAAPARC